MKEVKPETEMEVGYIPFSLEVDYSAGRTAGAWRRQVH